MRPAPGLIGFLLLFLLIPVSSSAADAGGGPIELPVSFQPVLVLQPRVVFRVEDRAPSRASELVPSLHRAELGFAVSGRFIAAAFAADASGGVPWLRDAFVDVGLLDGTIAVRVGYMRPPLGREVLAAGDRHLLPAEPESLDIVDPQRELGAELHGRIAGWLSYATGAWSGVAEGIDGTRRSGELEALAGGRVVVEPLGPMPAEEGASDQRGGGPRLAIGAAGLFGRRRGVPFPGRAEAGATYGEDRLRLGGEAAFKWAGMSATAELFWSAAWSSPGTEAALESRLPRVNGLGGTLQLAAFVVKKRLELAARCDAWDEDVDVGGALVAPMAGVSFYAVGTHVVLQLAYRARFAVEDPFPDGSSYKEPVTHDAMMMLQLSL